MSDQTRLVIEGILDNEGFRQTNGTSFRGWIKTHDAKVRADAKREALREATDELTEVIDDVQSGNRPNGVEWQTGALAMRDWLRATS